MPAPIDPMLAVLRQHAHEILASVAQDGIILPAPLSVTAGDETFTITLVISPLQMDVGHQLTPCERDILALLEASPSRLSVRLVQRELARRDQLHGDSTIAHALTRLVKQGIICNSRHAPRGYYLPR